MCYYFILSPTVFVFVFVFGGEAGAGLDIAEIW